MPKFLKVFEKYLFWSVLFLFVLIPLLPKLPLQTVPGTFVAIRLEDFIIAFILLFWGIYLIVTKQLKSFFGDRLNQALILFFFIGALSTFSAIYLTQTAQPHLAVLHYLRRVELLLLLPLAVSVIRSQKQIKKILIVLSAVILIVNLYALGQQ